MSYGALHDTKTRLCLSHKEHILFENIFYTVNYGALHTHTHTHDTETQLLWADPDKKIEGAAVRIQSLARGKLDRHRVDTIRDKRAEKQNVS